MGYLPAEAAAGPAYTGPGAAAGRSSPGLAAGRTSSLLKNGWCGWIKVLVWLGPLLGGEASVAAQDFQSERARVVAGQVWQKSVAEKKGRAERLCTTGAPSTTCIYEPRQMDTKVTRGRNAGSPPHGQTQSAQLNGPAHRPRTCQCVRNLNAANTDARSHGRVPSGECDTARRPLAGRQPQVWQRVDTAKATAAFLAAGRCGTRGMGCLALRTQ
jgi:hypothetical protein